MFNQYNRMTKEIFIDKLNNKFPNKFDILSDYVNSTTKIKIKCLTCNNVFDIRPSSLLSRGRCPNCSKLNRQPRENTWNRILSSEFKDKFYDLIKDEYTLLSEYIKAEDYIKVRHNVCGYEWTIRARNFISPSSANRCPICSRSHSKAEDELHSFIKSIYSGKVLLNDRDAISPYELDIYIPDKKVAIEYNGTYWHSAEYKDKNYHYNKSKLCEDRGIRLIHIWEYEWNNDRQKPILLNIIKSALGIIENKVYARKLDIEVRTSISMKDFFNKNNIQGFRPGKFAICLVDKNTREVYMSYMMGHCYFGKGKYEWEVIRRCY